MKSRIFAIILLVVFIGTGVALAEPYTTDCPMGDGVGARTSTPCSVGAGNSVVCEYRHQPTVGPAHTYLVRVQ